MSGHKKIDLVFAFFVCVSLVFTIFSFEVSAQETIEESYPEFFMGFQILESQQQAILDAIHIVDELQLGNMVILHPKDQNWSLPLMEEAISEADSLGLYTIFETYDYLDHEVRVTPKQFSSWQTKYPKLLGILVQEVSGKSARKRCKLCFCKHFKLRCFNHQGFQRTKHRIDDWFNPRNEKQLRYSRLGSVGGHLARMEISSWGFYWKRCRESSL
ncbi:MAG: hypothetical protein P8X87_07385 [Candidatus Bathyarchaeota archaeon]